MTATRVHYPAGAIESIGTVLHTEPLADGRVAVLLDETAFHPVDTAWPDQPSDRGKLRCADGRELEIDGVTGAISTDGELFIGSAVPVRTGSDGWVFVVAHLVPGPPPSMGETVSVSVDAEQRDALSAGHTACHLASLALDRALDAAWTKQVQCDALGAGAFDALACESSRIGPHCSVDRYRIGKSLRRKGFDPAALDDLSGVAARANAALAEWLATRAEVRIKTDGPLLTDRRYWVCEFPGASVSIPCGGTHVGSLGELAEVKVSLERFEVDGGLELEMRTSATRSTNRPGLA